jgi:SAM-dependent methyltransferase
MEEADGYFAWIYETLAPHMKGRVLEVGSGYGVFSDVLARRHGTLTATDYDPRSVEVLERKFAASPDVHVRLLDVLDAASVEKLAREEPVDTVVSLNVIEHLEDDVLALRHMARLVRPGGAVLVFVPALESLYGSLDRLAGHHRRYDKELLGERLRRAGLRPRELHYVNMLGAIGWFVNGQVMPQMSLDNPSVNGQARLYSRFGVGLAAAIERHLSPPFGQSLVAVAERPGA